jgi:AraC-like DNA-binding protein
MEDLKYLIDYLPIILSLFFLILFIPHCKINKPGSFIMGYMLIVFMTFATELIANLKTIPLSLFSYYVTIPLALCQIPMLYLYVLSLTNINFKLRKIHAFHFLLPSLLLLFNILTLGTIAFDVQRKLALAVLSLPDITPTLKLYINAYHFSQNIIYNLQTIFYTFLMIYTVIHHHKNIINYFSSPENKKLNWLSLFLIIIIFLSFLEIITFFNDFEKISPELYSLLTTSYILIIGYGAAWQHDIYRYSYKVRDKNKPLFSETIKKQEDPNISELAQKIKRIVEQEKFYLNPELTIEHIAEAVGSHRNTISKCINSELNMNFHQFIKSYRIDYAVKLMNDVQNHNITIEGIALNSGFRSKSVFNPAFKEQIGMTPSQYLKSLKNKS